MVYRVETSRRAERNLENIYNYIGAGSSVAAASWFDRFQDAILELQHAPHGHPFTHENPAYRQLVFGNKPHFYRAIYKVDDTHKLITIVHVRHGRRDR